MQSLAIEALDFRRLRKDGADQASGILHIPRVQALQGYQAPKPETLNPYLSPLSLYSSICSVLFAGGTVTYW